MTISIIAAIADNNAIGKNGNLLFRFSDDLRRFKQLTLGHTVIMGRNTFLSLPSGPLPGRRNIVLSRQPGWTVPGVTTASSIDEALKAVPDSESVFIIGGEQIYRLALPIAHRLLITRIFADDPLADTFFPAIGPEWEVSESSEILTDAPSGINFQFIDYTRRLEKADTFNTIFDDCIRAYHGPDCIDAEIPNPFPPASLPHLLWQKCLIDTRQWHLEDIIRLPDIDPAQALHIKRRIDASNQDRTDLVELIDEWFRNLFAHVRIIPSATINTETPAWAIDRLSILALKIWHMRIEANRPDASPAHRQRCADKLDILLQQRHDLSSAIDTLLDDIAHGRKYMKLYKQMKMYNDIDTNPALYASR